MRAGEEIRKRTNGTYEAQVFPASSPGKEADINQGLQRGTAGARETPLATVEAMKCHEVQRRSGRSSRRRSRW